MRETLFCRKSRCMLMQKAAGEEELCGTELLMCCFLHLSCLHCS